MSTRTYRSSDFMPSGLDSGTPQRKARFVNSLLRFIAEDCPKSRFTPTLYEVLAEDGDFGFTTRIDREDFYYGHLSRPPRRERFLIALRERCEQDSDADRPELWGDVKLVLAQCFADGTASTIPNARRLPPFPTPQEAPASSPSRSL